MKVLTMAPMAPDWDDEDELVDFQDETLDDTVNVAAETMEAAAAAEKQNMKPPEELSVMIRVAGNGAVVTNKSGSEELAGVVAYTHRLVELVGDLLGLEGFKAFECVFRGDRGATQERCLLFTETNGDTVLVRPRSDADIQVLRESLGL